jgi:Prokaryotic lipoprotein-attachment site
MGSTTLLLPEPVEGRYTFSMNKSHAKSLLCALALCLLVSACGNKGPLVKPEPANSEVGTSR